MPRKRQSLLRFFKQKLDMGEFYLNNWIKIWANNFNELGILPFRISANEGHSWISLSNVSVNGVWQYEYAFLGRKMPSRQIGRSQSQPFRFTFVRNYRLPHLPSRFELCHNSWEVPFEQRSSKTKDKWRWTRAAQRQHPRPFYHT